MNILAITPEEFSALAKGWLAVGSELIVPLTAFVGGVFGLFAYVQSRANELRLNRHGQTLNQIQQALPPPPAAPAEIPAGKS